MKKVGIFDIGTNSIHLKIVDIRDDLSFEVLGHEKDMTRLGDGSFLKKKLSKKTMRRAVRVIARFTNIARKEGVRRFEAIATSAVRDAQNKRVFLKEVRERSGVRVRVISGEEEARLIFLGAASGFYAQRTKILLIDIGGGSAEIVFGDRKKIDLSTSLPLGVTRLRDRFLSEDPPSKKNLRLLEGYIEERLEDFVKFMKRKKRFVVIGTAGTMITLASMIYEAREKRPLRLRGFFEISKKDVLRMHRKIIGVGLKKRKRFPGLDRKRADMIVAGSLFIVTLMRLFKIEKIAVSDKGVREGVILDILRRGKSNGWSRQPAVPVQWFGQKPFFAGRIIRPR